MSNWYSDLLTETGISQIALPSTPKINAAGVSHGRIRYKRCLWTGLALTTEEVRLMTLKSGDRLLQLFMSTVAGTLPTAGDWDLGLYATGSNHDGAEEDHDIFGAANDATSAQARVDIFTAGALTDRDRGRTLWEIASVGLASYTEDPLKEMDIVGTIDTSFTILALTCVVEAIYTSGD